jgi:hypothetical protein
MSAALRGVAAGRAGEAGEAAAAPAVTLGDLELELIWSIRAVEAHGNQVHLSS